MISESTLSLFMPLAIAFLIGAGAMGIEYGNRWRRFFSLCLGGAVYSLYDLAVGRPVEIQELPPWIVLLILAGIATIAVPWGGRANGADQSGGSSAC